MDGLIVALTKLRNALNDPRPLLQAVGLLMVGRAQSAFRDQGRGGVSWLPRGVPNRMGVLEDLKAGRSPPSRRWDATPAGIDTGRLRQSIAYRIEGATKVVVGSNLPYASDVQRGATKTLELDAGLRSSLSAWLKKLGGDKGTRARASFGPLFSLGALTITTPPRPFLTITPDDRREINETARRYFSGGYLHQ